MSINTKNRLIALEKAASAKPDLPRSICRMKDGTIKEVQGMSIIEPFLNEKIIEVVCDDLDIACLLRAMDTESTIKIESYVIVNGKPVRQSI